MQVKNIAVIGLGAMGSGIAYVCAFSGYNVYGREITEEFLEKGMNKIRDYFMSGVERGKLTPKQAQDGFSRIKTTTSLEKAVENADLVIEAVFEELELKKKIFSQLDEASLRHTILASNTSTLSITELSKATEREEKVVGMHFFNPVPAMKLVEIVKGEKTSHKTIEAVRKVSERLGKESVLSNDGPGFIFNRILIPTAGEILKIFEEGIAPMIYIDKISVRSAFPMGPFALLDFVGLDVAFHATETLHRGLGEYYKPSELLSKTVALGHLGMKTGKGLLDFDKPDLKVKKTDEYILNRILYVMINEASKCAFEEKIASIEDVDKAMRLGGNFSKGPFELADELGLDSVVSGLDSLREEKKNDFYKPSRLLSEKVDAGKLGVKTGKGFYEYG
ncbi:MAG: 3-hydroxyacyl-CoA dehydrogenase [Candidatus Methanofastidiosia archaeon]